MYLIKSSRLKIISILFCLFLSNSCVLNPKYSDTEQRYENEINKYPRDSEQIKRNKEAFKEWQITERTKPSANEAYIIVDDKKSGWSVGNPDALLHFGLSNYKYHHKITIKLVCNKNSFIPIPASNLKVHWKISDLISATGHTAKNGVLPIHIVTDSSHEYPQITLIIEDNPITVVLSGDLTIEVDNKYCSN